MVSKAADEIDTVYVWWKDSYFIDSFIRVQQINMVALRDTQIS